MEVEMFASIEEAMERLEKARQAADMRVKPWQAQVKPGNYFVNIDACVKSGLPQGSP